MKVKGRLTFPNDAVVLHEEHLSRYEDVLHLLQQLGSEAGDGDLLRRHERGERGVHAASGEGQAGEHGPRQRAGRIQRRH